MIHNNNNPFLHEMLMGKAEIFYGLSAYAGSDFLFIVAFAINGFAQKLKLSM